ncbi:DUF3558 family protein [Corynebacterium jeddahense]|uniref:DUF3558 domain-containing protein n=1 Tax=Corynebacterium jeddahense TaxID=1414719 RepID=A0ABY7UJ93_9CORY|nr:DUF3558 family protein [Corynebacterium jeddahense]WCZ38434.1 hypothetical protein CJEDD_04095 [Corynebacterium jeddahense]
MKRNFAGLLVGCGLLAGCSGPSLIDDHRSPSPTPTTAETTPGGGGTDAATFVFDSGVLEIGDFDPYTLGDNIFDPCTEISPEEFAAAGFDNIEPMPEEYRGLARGLSVCDFSKHPEVPSEGFSNNNASRKEIEAQGSLYEKYRSDLLPSMFVYGPRSGTGTYCYAQVDTLRGGLVSQIAGFEGYQSQDVTCSLAIENLENLFRATRAS